MTKTAVLFSTLTLLTLVFAAQPATSGPTDPFFSTLGEVVVGFEAERLPDVQAGERWNGFEVVQVVPSAPFLVVRSQSVEAVLERVAGAAGVAYVEDNGLLHALLTPNDPRYGDQYGPGMMGFPSAWDVAGLGAASVTVAVLDTGIQKSHPDFDPALILQGYDYSNGDTNPNDDCGHGTHVSGTVGAWTDNAKGVAGMSQSSILHMKVLAPSLVSCSGSHADIAEAIYDAADQGARIISMSLGGPSGSSTLKNAVDYEIGRAHV